ncbi:MAG: hypothetical protein GF313_02470 [Caldithrix sp.]|nr:hypothetical protein [Caldithrix sp.]
MKRFVIVMLLVLVSTANLLAVDFKVNGVYTAWAQSQHAFNLSDDAYDHNYAVQMLRFNVQAVTSEHLKVVTRFDMAQGWWGVDNSLRSVQRPYGAYGGSSLFDYKDTNFLFHVDQAYVDFDVPEIPINARIGRMWYGVGNKIMLDNNYDGIQVDLNNVIGKKLTLGWAKVSEGADALDDQYNEATGMDSRDADLLMVNFENSIENFHYNTFGFYYTDRSVDDMNAFVPNNLQFFKTRFSPQITQLTAIGLSGTYKAGKLTVDGEADFLMGKDDIDNDSHGNNQLVDINDGDLSGYNIYVKANYAASDKLSVGAVGGMGSGDDDLTEGAGNVNKLRTSGFFYITEIWEDSIMPDEEGITPQGIGAPNVRGYRELENSTLFQVNGNYKLTKKLSGFLSYTYIMATQPIYEWNPDGTPNMDGESANDLGQEIDFKFVYGMQPELKFLLRGGYFMPGDAAGYLLNGSTALDDPAWELKGMVLYKF